MSFADPQNDNPFGGRYSSGRDPNAEWERLSNGLRNKVNKLPSNDELQRLILQAKNSDNLALADQISQRIAHNYSLINEIKVSINDLQKLANEGDQNTVKIRNKTFSEIYGNFQSWGKRSLKLREEWFAIQKQTVRKMHDNNRNSFEPRESDRLVGDQTIYEDGQYLATLKEREQKLNELESSIIVVNEIFRDLDMIVIEQGDMVNSIENSIEHAKESTIIAVENLNDAREYQKKSNNKLYCIALLCFIILAFLCGLVFLVVKFF